MKKLIGLLQLIKKRYAIDLIVKRKVNSFARRLIAHAFVVMIPERIFCGRIYAQEAYKVLGMQVGLRKVLPNKK